MSTLVIAEHDNSSMNVATLNSVAAAQAMGGDIDILVVGTGCQSAAEQAAQVPGIGKVLVADNAAYAHSLAENVAPMIAEVAAGYSHVMATATTTAKNIIPRVAALLDVQSISDISGVVSEDTFKRPIYAGNLIATVQSSDAIKVLTVRGTAFDAAPAEGGSASIEALASAHDSAKSSFIGEEVAVSDRPELTAADIVISGGRGMGNGENFDMLYSLADKLGAAVGASCLLYTSPSPRDRG